MLLPKIETVTITELKLFLQAFRSLTEIYDEENDLIRGDEYPVFEDDTGLTNNVIPGILSIEVELERNPNELKQLTECALELYNVFQNELNTKYTEALEKISQLKQLITQQLAILENSLISKNDPNVINVSLVDISEIVDVFDYADYLEERYTTFNQYLFLLKLKNKPVKPKLSIIKPGVH